MCCVKNSKAKSSAKNAVRNSNGAALKRKRRSPAEIKDRLLSAARDEFKRCGFIGATTATIAANADVTEAQLFRYYASKADLFRDAVFEPLNKHFSDFNTRHLTAAERAEDLRGTEERYISELLEFIGEHAKLLQSLIVAEAYSGDRAHGVSQIDSLQNYFQRGAAMQAKRIGKNARVDPKLMVRVSFGAVLGCVMFRDWLFPKNLANDAQVNAAIMDFIIDGLNANSQE